VLNLFPKWDIWLIQCALEHCGFTPLGQEVVELILDGTELIHHKVLLALDLVEVGDVLLVLTKKGFRLVLDLLHCFYLTDEFELVILKLIGTFVELFFVSSQLIVPLLTDDVQGFFVEFFMVII
jgi:hypothetical protein